MSSKAFLGITLLTEHLDEVVTGEHLFDLRVEVAGVVPLRDEAEAFDRRVMNEIVNNDSGMVTIATNASSTSMREHHHDDADDREQPTRASG